MHIAEICVSSFGNPNNFAHNIHTFWKAWHIVYAVCAGWHIMWIKLSIMLKYSLCVFIFIFPSTGPYRSKRNETKQNENCFEIQWILILSTIDFDNQRVLFLWFVIDFLWGHFQFGTIFRYLSTKFIFITKFVLIEL